MPRRSTMAGMTEPQHAPHPRERRRDLLVAVAACAASVALAGVTNVYVHGSTPLELPGAASLAARPDEQIEPSEGNTVEIISDPGEFEAAAASAQVPPPSVAPRLEHVAEPARMSPGSARASQEAAELLADAARARRVGDVPRAIAFYDVLQRRYPGTLESRTADMPLGMLHLRQGAWTLALEHFDRYLRHSPHGEFEPEAMWARAQALSSLGRTLDAHRSLNRLQLLYPNSPYATQARAKLASEPSEL